jgi:hypothetical protein
MMDEIVPRRRGRPRGSTTVPPDLLARIWVQVLMTRVELRKRTGKTPSVRKACREIADKGGIISAVGGSLNALVAASAESKKRRQRFRFSPEGGVSPNATGSIFASHTISNADTLHVRYSWAKEIVAVDPKVRLVWMNLARQMLGLPTKRRVQRFMSRMSRGPV